MSLIQLFLHRFSDRAYLARLDLATNWSWSPAGNGAGAFSFEYPLDADEALLMEQHKTYIVALLNGDEIFSGKIIDLDDDIPEQGEPKVGVSCLGWWEIVEHRPTHDELVFLNKSCGNIAWALLAHSQLFDGDLGFEVGPSQDAGFVIPKLTIAEDSNIAEWIIKLTQVENGIDFEYDPLSDTYKFYSAIGEDKTATVRFSRGARGLGNLASIGRRYEGARKVNKIKAISSTTSNYVRAGDATSIAETGAYVEVTTLSGISSDVSEQTLLNAYIVGEIAVRKNGITTYRFNVNKDADVPMPPQDFGMFDLVSVTANVGRISLNNQAVRVFGWTLAGQSLDDAALTSISLAP